MPSTEFYTLSLHDALPISEADHGDDRDDRSALASETRTASLVRVLPHSKHRLPLHRARSATPPGYSGRLVVTRRAWPLADARKDRKSTRLNSSHSQISYAVHRVLHSFPTRRSSDL